MEDDYRSETEIDSASTDISSLQSQVRSLERKQHQASRRSEAILFGQLLFGSVFLAISFILLLTTPSLFKPFSILTSIISLFMLTPALFELLFSSKERFWNAIGGILLLSLSGLLIMIWQVVLKDHALIVSSVLLGIVFLFFAWVLFHMLLRYSRNGVLKFTLFSSLSFVIAIAFIAMIVLRGNALIFSCALIATIVFVIASINYARNVMRSMLQERR